MQQILWQDRFNIGVEMIDQAHHNLFSIVQKIMELYTEKHDSKFACVEGIKYFKAYALKHFAEEEAYMREAGYPGYLNHKRLHDRMRRETLPALERELYATNFSTPSVQRFIGVCTGWLTGHIMIEDRAITGRTAGEYVLPHPDDKLSVIQTVITGPLQEMFGSDVRFMGRFTGEEAIYDAQYYELVYGTRQGEKLRVVLVIGERLLLRAAGLMLGLEFYSVNEIVRFAVQEIAQGLIQRASACFGKEPDAYQLEEDRFLEAEEFWQRFREQPPCDSLLFQVKQGSFALCIDRRSGEGAGPDAARG